ncbi:Crp/Fnr family transcriptional regulator, partial [Epilithonimonas sp. FP105]
FTTSKYSIKYSGNNSLSRSSVFILYKSINFCYYSPGFDLDPGNIIYKLFFEENSFCASTSSIIQESPSEFSIVALEDSEVIVYSANIFRKLITEHHDLALFQIAYLEKNWVVKKEPLEINLKSESAKQRYKELHANQKLFNRLKQHQIASYLGITPTQLSRIRRELNF